MMHAKRVRKEELVDGALGAMPANPCVQIGKRRPRRERLSLGRDRPEIEVYD